MLNRIIDFFTSLRLTVICLSMAMVLVFAGTLAQVNLGLYVAQDKYFQSLLVFWTPKGTDLSIPVWPGGYLLGWVLLINLIAAHVKRFTFSKKKIGIFLTHAGLILLLVGQFLTELFQVESTMRLEEGQTKNYTEDSFKNELAIVDVTDPNHDRVIAFPESFLGENKELRHPDLPFTVRIKEYFPNSWPGSSENGQTVRATDGIGARLPFSEQATTARMDDENKPTALVEIASESGVVGAWTVSNWLSKYPWVGVLEKELGPDLGNSVKRPQTFTVGDRTYRIALRPVRYYKPYSIHLHDFRHDRYIGTEVAKNFSSRIQLRNPERGEDREVLIYMNNPLRYAGETYYQGSFERGDTTSILHVVRNPAWLTPYFGCTIVGLGLTIQFMMHLVGFARRTTTDRNQQKPQAPAGRKRPAPRDERGPAIATAAGITAKRRTV